MSNSVTLSSNFFISQIGSREHYLAARAVHSRGALRTLYTDAWCSYSAVLRHGPGRLGAFGNRWHQDIPARKVVAFTADAIRCELERLLLHRSTTVESTYESHVRYGSWYADRVRRDLALRPISSEADVFFAYSTGCLETVEMLRDRGVITVVDQIDAARVHEDVAYSEVLAWPGWQPVPGRVPSVYWERLSAEWQCASLVLVNSQWSRAALTQQGVPEDKVVVIPLAYEPAVLHPIRERRGDVPLTVLWLGRVTLSKGIQYLVQAARSLEHTNVRFLVAGHVGVSPDAIATAPANMHFLGGIQCHRTPEVYRLADVFVLPTLSDGFAITQLEAMSHGLPVITTGNCGDVVTHGEDGLIIPARDSHALARAIASLEGDRTLVQSMSNSALVKAKQFTVSRYAEQLDAAVSRHRFQGSLRPSGST